MGTAVGDTEFQSHIANIDGPVGCPAPPRVRFRRLSCTAAFGRFAPDDTRSAGTAQIHIVILPAVPEFLEVLSRGF